MIRRKAIGLLGSSMLLTPSGVLQAMEASLLQERRNLEQTSAFATDSNDDDFWSQIRMAYPISPNLINLNNGGVAPSPRVVQEALDFYNRLCNEAPSYYMWRILDSGREPMRARMAQIAVCDTEELAFVRNSSEALETVIFGLPLNAGDEVILTKQDYPNMINAWKQREKRDGIVLKWVHLNLPIEDDNVILKAYQEQITARTKILHVTHVINWVGQVLPARKLADLAHRHQAEILLDAAHSFAHLPYAIRDLDCDYFGTSLHKWLSAPIGSGLLYIRKDRISKVFPLLAAADPMSGDIRKFEALGTRSFAIEQAIQHSMDFYQMIGSERKFARLCTLKERWIDQVKSHAKVKLWTPLSRQYSGAIASLTIQGKKAAELSDYLYNKYKIHTVSIVWEDIECVRITPNVYHTMAEMDLLAKAILEFANS